MPFELRIYGVNPLTIEAEIRGLADAPPRGLSVYQVDLGVMLIIDREPTVVFKRALDTLLHQRILEEAVRRGIEPPPSDDRGIIDQLVEVLRQNGVIPPAEDTDPVGP